MPITLQTSNSRRTDEALEDWGQELVQLYEDWITQWKDEPNVSQELINIQVQDKKVTEERWLAVRERTETMNYLED